MALKSCPECGAQISTTAASCPQCGAPQSESRIQTGTDAAKNGGGQAAWICLVVAWVTFLFPMAGIGVFIGWPLNFVAFILAILEMSKRGASAGLWQLLASLIASPIIYFVGVAVLAAYAKSHY